MKIPNLVIPERVQLPTYSLPNARKIPTASFERPTAEIPSYEPLRIPLIPETGKPVQERPPGVAPEEEQNPQSKKERKERSQERKESPQSASPPPEVAPAIPSSAIPSPNLPVPDIDTLIQQVEERLQLEPPSPKEITTTTIPGTNIEVPVPAPEVLVAAGATSTISVGAALAASQVFERAQSVFKPIIKKALKIITKLQKKPPPLSWARERALPANRLSRSK
jgi:hypothetical protein